MANKKEYSNYYEEMANKLAEQIENCNAPWQKVWEGGKAYIPFNIKSGKDYQGINIFQLMSQPYTDPRWLTYKQATELNGAVLKGEKGTRIVYIQTTEKVKEKDENGNEVEKIVLLDKPKSMWSVVFNAQQCEGLPHLENDSLTKYQWNPIDKAQEIIDSCGIEVQIISSKSAFYSPSIDKVTMPLKEQFPIAEDYYRVALHELGHATGHESRLDRFSKMPMGAKSRDRAKEELVAEISSFLTGSVVGLGHKPNENTLAYIKSWSQFIRDDPKFLVKACQEADKATKFLVGDLKKELNQERENATAKNIENHKPTYINVPKEEKDEAKELGAKWDKNVKSWFMPAGIDTAKFNKWNIREVVLMNNKADKYFIAVPYIEKDEARKLGAKWDKDAQSWYCNTEDKDKFSRWNSQNATYVKDSIALDPKEEFFNQIAPKGINADSSELIADGEKHRIAVEGDKGKEQSGFYVLHADGVANGYFMNNRTGETVKWVQKGYNLTNEDRVNLHTVAKTIKANREAENNAREEKAVTNLRQFFHNAPHINTYESNYFKNKDILSTDNVFKSKYGEIAIPLIDIKGNIVSAQYINNDGEKKFASNCRRNGAFHLLNGKIEDLAKADKVILAEGYSTAVTVNEAVKNSGVPVIATMGASNIENIVASIQENFPRIEKIALAVDNDVALAMKGIRNVGRDTAEDVASRYNNKVVTVIPSMNGNEVEGDFNDLTKKAGKDVALKSIASQFEKALGKEKSFTKEKEVAKTKEKALA